MSLASILAAAYAGPSGPLNAAVHSLDEMLADARRHTTDADHALFEYLRLGHLNRCTLQQLLAWAGTDWDQLDAVLDFAGGYGRLTRFLLQHVPNDRLWVGEVMSTALAFQRATFGVHTIASTMDATAVTFPRRFDLIVVISLFTHLPRAAFTAWLDRLAGALDDGGLLVFTTHGSELFAEGWRRPLHEELYFEPVSENSTLDPQSYGRTYVRPDFVADVLARVPGIDLLAHLPRGLAGGQDLFVVGRSRPRPAQPPRLRQPPVGAVDWAGSVGSGIRLRGWALDADQRPVRRATLLADQRRLGDVQLGQPRPDLAETTSSTSPNGGWCFDVPPGTNWPSWLTLQLEDADGLRGLSACPVAHLSRLSRSLFGDDADSGSANGAG